MARKVGAEPTRWHVLDGAEVARLLGVDPAKGLTEGEAARRRERRGANEIPEAARRPAWRMFLAQFADFMILVLLAAAVVSGALGEPLDALAIVVIVLLNAAIGTIQEYRAERALAALRSMAAPTARVLREGSLREIPARELVPGDVILLEAGNIVPADLRLLQVAELGVEEAALTGESVPVAKLTSPVEDPRAPLGDRADMCWKGTQVVRGRGTGLCVAIGLETELGRIARLLGEAEAVRTPIQKRLTRFGQRLALTVLGISAVIFAAGLLRGEELVRMFLTAVSLAVAAIPEALPAVVTVSLALGARKMARQNALMRRLPAVETLGSVTFICADKTGTLTRNTMAVETLSASGRRLARLPPPDQAPPPWRDLGAALALSNDASIDGAGRAHGDPTEVALLQAAQASGYARDELDARWPRVAEVAFTAGRKRMATVHRVDGRYHVFVKGAPEQVLPRCTSRADDASGTALDRAAVLEEAEALAAQGYRVLGFAQRRLDRLPPDAQAETIESDLVFLGLVALIDPPRDEVPAAVRDCRSAGITPVMITGDHPATARAIAARIGVIREGAPVLSGPELDALDDDELAARVKDTAAYARVDPEQKIRIVRALQKRGEFTAMTGDGVNDAPALKAADIGVAMGLKGTDVARQAADMVLLDDNFATIVAAVREGRRIFDNIRKFIKYTMTSNSGEIWTLFLAPFLGLPIPLLPIHILWVNLVTDGLPGLALAAEPAERGVMARPPRPPSESIFAHGMWQHMVWVGLLIGGVSILAQAAGYHASAGHWQTMCFTVLVVSQLFHALAIRSDRESLWRQGLTSNPALLGAVLLTLGLQLAVVYAPWAQPVFKTQALSASELAACLGLALVVPLAVEVEKALVRRGLLYGARPTPPR